MDIRQLRHANYLALFAEFKKANATLPDRGMIKLFGEKIGVSERYASNLKCGAKNIGGIMARRIEEAMGRPHGWLDQPHKGQQTADDNEQFLIDALMTLYRQAPKEAQQMVMDIVRARVEKTAPAPKKVRARAKATA